MLRVPVVPEVVEQDQLPPAQRPPPPVRPASGTHAPARRGPWVLGRFLP